MTNRFRTNFSRWATFDIETDGRAETLRPSSNAALQPEVSTVWCGVVIDQDGCVLRYGPNDIPMMVRHLLDHEMVVGHNSIEFDWRVLKRLYAEEFEGRDEPVLIDTLVVSRMFWPDKNLHQHTNGKGNSLKAWGLVLDGEGKIDYQGGFDHYSKDMMEYCVGDVDLTKRLWEWLRDGHVGGYEDALEREHRRAERLARMTEYGVCFDFDAADDLIAELSNRQVELTDRLTEAFPPRIETMKTPAYYEAGGRIFDRVGDAKLAGFKRDQIKAGPLRTKSHPFEPGSADQVAARLKAKYGWTAPTTEKGKPSITEEVLDQLTYPEAAWVSEWRMLTKRIGAVSDYRERACASRDGRLHPTVRPTGTVTGRCAGSQPNPQNVTSARKPYGIAIRKLFIAGEGRKLVSIDADQMEVRIIAHHLARFDGGAYARQVAGTDAHQVNADLMGVNRDGGKLGGLSLMYGISPASLARKLGKTHDEGVAIHRQFHQSLPSLAHFQQWCETHAVTRSHMRLIDGRDAPVRCYDSGEPQAPVNTLIQGDGQCFMTLVWELVDEEVRRRDLDAHYVLEVHDEATMDATADQATELAEIMEVQITEAGRQLGLAIEMTGKASIGDNWYEIH